MKLKGFLSQSFDFDTTHAVGVVFKQGKNEWRHAVRISENASPEQVAKALKVLAKAVEKASLPVSNWWQK